MIDAIGKIDAGNSKAVEKVAKILEAKGRLGPKSKRAKGEFCLAWGLTSYAFDRDTDDYPGWDHTLADFNLDADGNDLPTPHKFKDGDRVAEEAQPAYQFGDQIVVVGNHSGPRYYISEVAGHILHGDESAINAIRGDKRGWVRSIPAHLVSPWPIAIPFDITPNRPAIAENGTVTFDGVTLTIEQMEAALDNAKKTNP